MEADGAVGEPLTNGELTVEAAGQNQIAVKVIPNGDVISNMSEKAPEKDGEFRIIRHLRGVQVACGSITTFSVLSSGSADKVCYLENFNLTDNWYKYILLQILGGVAQKWQGNPVK